MLNRTESLKSIILFGTGKKGRELLPHIKKKYTISHVIDNNANLWGTTLEGIEVQSPEEIIGSKDSIVVATSIQSFWEISAQLKKISIEPARIMWPEMTSSDVIFHSIPFLPNKWENSNRGIESYDVLQAPQNHASVTNFRTDKTVMVFCSFNSVYAISMIKNMKERYPEISVSMLSRVCEYVDALKQVCSHIYCYKNYEELNDILTSIPKYDVFQMLWIEDDWVLFADSIRRKCRCLNLHVGGSDFYRSGPYCLESKRKIVRMADRVTAETETTIHDFCRVYPEAGQKIRWLNFGIDELDYEGHEVCQNAKSHFGLEKDKVIVTCGHNARKEHQHKEIIGQLSILEDEIIGMAEFVFPMTYGDSGKYTDGIRRLLSETKITSLIMTRFMNSEEMARYAACSDIMVHVQTTDQLSSTMLQEMHAGAVVIAGSWLPYQMLKDKGVYFLTIDSISELSAVLTDVIRNLKDYKKRCEGNRKIIYEMSSWNHVAARWKRLWDEELLG